MPIEACQENIVHALSSCLERPEHRELQLIEPSKASFTTASKDEASVGQFL
jgi:hypothetical protein